MTFTNTLLLSQKLSPTEKVESVFPFWKINYQGHFIYLLGTVHQLDENTLQKILPLVTPILLKCSKLVTEVCFHNKQISYNGFSLFDAELTKYAEDSGLSVRGAENEKHHLQFCHLMERLDKLMFLVGNEIKRLVSHHRKIGEAILELSGKVKNPYIPLSLEECIYNYSRGKHDTLIFPIGKIIKETKILKDFFLTFAPHTRTIVNLMELIIAHLKSMLAVNKKRERQQYQAILTSLENKQNIFFAFGTSHFLNKNSHLEKLQNLGAGITQIQTSIEQSARAIPFL